ncbi:MAG: CPBP family glutamic-type intramembrane protease [Candidatus Lokiarchaeota archaeon]|jgi:membrane protease YdiL (CAAX protease family)
MDENNTNHPNIEDKYTKNVLKLNFCPICGQKIPENQKGKYCIKCGVDLYYVQEHMRVPSPHNLKSLNPPISSTQRLSDDELSHLKDHKLWGAGASIGLTFAGFVSMNIIAAMVIFIIIFLNIGSGNLLDLMENPYVTIYSSLAELIFILIPVLYVGRFLKKPSLSNRFAILGFTTRGYSKIGILKEVLIGLSFAIIGIFVVLFASIFMQILLELIFGTDIVFELGGSGSEIDAIIYNADPLSLIFLIVTMILVIGTSEELLFRGFLQKGLTRTIGNRWGILVTALIFSAIHLIGIFLLILTPLAFFISFLLSFLPYLAISLLLGLLFYWRKENLIAVAITHGVYDVLTILLVFMLYNIF